MTIIAQGAEAILKRDNDHVIKERIPKQYRHPEIDATIRADRTSQEKRLLEKAQQAGVPTPAVEQIDDHTLKIEWISGTPVREHLETDETLWPTIGEYLGRLHANDIIHGDLTTSNMLYSKDNEIIVIDFGLGYFSQRIEDRATDIRLLRQTLEATHNTIWNDAFSTIMETYHDTYDESEDVEQRMHSIENRQRYT
ncbi:MAG: Kae1-associated serine/threonine protein kinase [Candidatus Nanohaloarchaeota archaeon QJJ-5]|nr:Kae1-associated serine/threonine protein kinase [Candidatus Nanohaloarchaeota archaeon QJJ-5]